MIIHRTWAGPTELSPGSDLHTASINIEYVTDSTDNPYPHLQAIECHGEGVEGAEELRDRILMCLNLHDELVEALKIAHPYISNDAARKIVGDLIVKAEER